MGGWKVRRHIFSIKLSQRFFRYFLSVCVRECGFRGRSLKWLRGIFLSFFFYELVKLVFQITVRRISYYTTRATFGTKLPYPFVTLISFVQMQKNYRESWIMTSPGNVECSKVSE